MYEVSKDEILKLANSQGLIKKIETDCEQDQLKRSEVSWETLAFELPDDGTGAFPLLRNIVVNNNKSSTYKLGLLRCLIRIAEGHPGAVINREEGMVELPLGLVAFYWVKIYQKLVDHSNLQQPATPIAVLSGYCLLLCLIGWQMCSLHVRACLHNFRR